MGTQAHSTDAAQPLRRAHRQVALALLALVAGMVALSYAAVPLYRLFCQVTGYGGTTQRAARPPGPVIDRLITVRFDANVSSQLNWTFEPVQREVTLKLGENKLAFYQVRNLSDKATYGTATFNVTPEIAGGYFNKIECFCFKEQRLEAGQRAEMPVSFFIDPALLDTPDTRTIQEITLSYTFFPAAGPKPRESASGGKQQEESGS